MAHNVEPDGNGFEPNSSNHAASSETPSRTISIEAGDNRTELSVSAMTHSPLDTSAGRWKHFAVDKAIRETHVSGMPTVKPYAVRDEIADNNDLVFAVDALAARHRYLRFAKQIGRKDRRLDILESGKVRAAEVFAYVLRDERRPAFRHPVYAGSAEETLKWGRAQWPEHAGTLYVEPTDHIEALLALPDRNIVDIARSLWTSHKPGGSRQRIVPYVYNFAARRPKNAVVKKLQPTTRLQIVYAIRLAMILEFMGVPESSRNSPKGLASRPAVERARKRKLHGENIPDATIRDMIQTVGPDMAPFDETATLVLERFVTQYGYDPKTLRWTEIAELWNNGPEGLERARIDGTLDKHAYFRHGRPKRADFPDAGSEND